MDCGPTCLRMISKYYGKTIMIDSLRNKSQFNKAGVSILGISIAAESIGIHTNGVKTTLKELINEVTLPCILHWNQNHFVVLYKANKNNFTIADPAKGIIQLSKEDFLKSWISNKEESKGIALLLEPTPAFFEQENEKNKGIGWGLLSKYTFKYKAQIVQLFLGLLIGSLLQLIFPLMTSLYIIFVRIILYIEFI